MRADVGQAYVVPPRRDRLAADLGTDQFERHDQTVGALDLRLGGGEGDGFSVAISNIAHNQAEGKRQRRLDYVRGDWVVTIHIPLEEIVRLQVGIGQHKEGDWRPGDGDLETVQNVG